MKNFSMFSYSTLLVAALLLSSTNAVPAPPGSSTESSPRGSQRNLGSIRPVSPTRSNAQLSTVGQNGATSNTQSLFQLPTLLNNLNTETRGRQLHSGSPMQMSSGNLSPVRGVSPMNIVSPGSRGTSPGRTISTNSLNAPLTLPQQQNTRGGKGGDNYVLELSDLKDAKDIPDDYKILRVTGKTIKSMVKAYPTLGDYFSGMDLDIGNGFKTKTFFPTKTMGIPNVYQQDHMRFLAEFAIAYEGYLQAHPNTITSSMPVKDLTVKQGGEPQKPVKPKVDEEATKFAMELLKKNYFHGHLDERYLMNNVHIMLGANYLDNQPLLHACAEQAARAIEELKKQFEVSKGVTFDNANYEQVMKPFFEHINTLFGYPPNTVQNVVQNTVQNQSRGSSPVRPRTGTPPKVRN